MREVTIWRKKTSGLFQEIRRGNWLVERLGQIISEGKRGLDGLVLELGRMILERSCTWSGRIWLVPIIDRTVRSLR